VVPVSASWPWPTAIINYRLNARAAGLLTRRPLSLYTRTARLSVTEAILPTPKNPPGRNGFKYKPQYGVVIVCGDEAKQQATYQALKQQGYKVRVVCV